MNEPDDRELLLFAAGFLDDRRASVVRQYLNASDAGRRQLQRIRQQHATLLRTYECYDQDHDVLREQLLSSLPNVVPDLPDNRPRQRVWRIWRPVRRLGRVAAVFVIVLGMAWMLYSPQKERSERAGQATTSLDPLQVQEKMRQAREALGLLNHQLVAVGRQVVPAMPQRAVSEDSMEKAGT